MKHLGLKLKLLIRLLILFSFLTPFLTCNSFNTTESTAVSDYITSYNSSKANLKMDSNVSIAGNKSSKSLKNKLSDESFFKIIYSKIFYPTDNSISGFGAIFLFPILAGQILIGLSFLLTFFLAFSWWFLKKGKLRFYLIALNAVLIIAFIIIGLFGNNVNFQWGVWLTLALIITQLFYELGSIG